MIGLAPLWIALGFWLGTRLEVPLSQLHPTVRLADRILQEQTGRVEDTIDASDAFRNTGRAPAELYREAFALSAMFRTAGGWFGAWVGLVIAVKLIHLSIRRQRPDYQPDRAGCVSCGRCFWYCPVEQAKQGWVQEIDSPTAETMIHTPANQPNDVAYRMATRIAAVAGFVILVTAALLLYDYSRRTTKDPLEDSRFSMLKLAARSAAHQRNPENRDSRARLAVAPRSTFASGRLPSLDV